MAVLLLVSSGFGGAKAEDLGGNDALMGALRANQKRAELLGTASGVLPGGLSAAPLNGEQGEGQPASSAADQNRELHDLIKRNQEQSENPLSRVHPARLLPPEPAPLPRRGKVDGKSRFSQGRGSGRDELFPDVTRDVLRDRLRDQEKPPVPQPLKQFGYDLFERVPSTFAPVTNVPIPADYIVGPGDTIQIQLTGKEFKNFVAKVNRDGMIDFPGIGLVPVAGVSFLELKGLLTERVKAQLIGMELSHVTLGTLRSIRVFILGDVLRPGAFTVGALSTMVNALFASGGVTPMGSLRRVQLKRKDQLVTTLDLYDLLLEGNANNDTRLQDGDVLFVPPIGSTVGVEGDVHRPGIFELKDEKSVQEVLKMAGGFLPSAFKKGVQLERIQEGKGRQILALDLSRGALSKTRVQNGDTLRVQSVLEKMDDVVTLSGHVERPGPYQWRRGLRLTDVIPSARALQENPDLGYVLIRREIDEGQRWKFLITRLDQPLANRASAQNTLLEPRDEILVLGLNEDRAKTLEPWITELRRQTPSDQLEPIVGVAGNVRYPGIYPFAQGMRVSELIRSAAETLPGTDLDYALLVRVLDKDGRIAPFSVRLRDLLGNEGSPGDILVRPEDRLLVFASSSYFEEYGRNRSRKGLFFRDLKSPGQGEAPDRKVAKDSKQGPFSGAVDVTSTRIEEFYANRNAPKGETERASAAQRVDPSPGRGYSGGPLGRDGLSEEQRLLLLRQGKGGDGYPDAADAEPDVPVEQSSFGQFNQRERFKQFRKDVAALPAFMTGTPIKEEAGIMPKDKEESSTPSKEDRMKFSFLRVPVNSPELADHFYNWSQRTREGLLKPVLDQLQAQATFSQPSRIVSVAGMVRFPGKYPLEEGMHISDLIRAGGWMAEPAYSLDAEVTRYFVIDQKNREIKHLKVVLGDVLSGAPSADFSLQPFDSLTIKPIPNWTDTMQQVSVQGEVRFPGVYPVRKGETLKQLIERAGGLTEFAFPEGAIFLREDLKDRERKEMEALAHRLEGEVVKYSLMHSRSSFNADAPNSRGMAVDPTVLNTMLAQLRNARPQGRLAIDLPAILTGAEVDENKAKESTDASGFFWESKKSAAVSLRLRDGDQILLPQKSSEVTVLGEVNYPTSHQFRPGKSPEEYVSLSGGFSNGADKDAIYIVKANGQVIPRNAGGGVFGSAWFNAGSGVAVSAGDTVVVPLKTDQVEALQFVKEISTVLYNLAITTAGIKQVGVLK